MFCIIDEQNAIIIFCTLVWSPHPASFRFRLTADTLAFGYILPTTGRIRDFHPLETCAAGRTIKREGFQQINKSAESLYFKRFTHTF
jgi:hypothetical protein